MDLKKLGQLGYMLVVVCHFTSFVWLTFLSDKRATGVANFLLDTVIPDIKSINKQRVEATKEAAADDGLHQVKASEDTSEEKSGSTSYVPITVEAMGEYRKTVLQVR